VEKSLGFVAVQPRGGAVTIPIEARRALRLDAPGAQVEVILRDNDLVLIPHVAVPLEQMREDAAARARDGQAGHTADASGGGRGRAGRLLIS